MTTITVNTETLTNDQVAQLVAILSQAAATAYGNAADNGASPDSDAAAKWAGDYMEHHTAATNAYRVLRDRTGDEEAADLCDTFGADPEFC